MTHEFRPVIVDGQVQTHDVFVDGEWRGSRRTLAQCEEMVDQPRAAVGEKNSLTDEELGKLIDKTLSAEFPKQMKVVNWLVGEVMKRTKGKASPEITKRVIMKKLELLVSD